MRKNTATIFLFAFLTGCDIYNYQTILNPDDLAIKDLRSNFDSLHPADLISQKSINISEFSDAMANSSMRCKLATYSTEKLIVTLIPDYNITDYWNCSSVYQLKFQSSNDIDFKRNKNLIIDISYRAKSFVHYETSQGKVGLYLDDIEIGIITDTKSLIPISSIGGYIITSKGDFRNLKLFHEIKTETPIGIYVKYDTHYRRTSLYDEALFRNLFASENISFIQFNSIQITDYP